MKDTPLLEFIADKSSGKLSMKRNFRAERPLVWDCWTKTELLEQWFAPKPMTTKTGSRKFENGGHWHYAMVDSNGTEYWGYTEYVSVQPVDFFTTIDHFSNDKGELNNDLPGARWKVEFIDNGETTDVIIDILYNSPGDLEKVLEMGMRQGMEMTLEKLDELLENKMG